MRASLTIRVLLVVLLGAVAVTSVWAQNPFTGAPVSDTPSIYGNQVPEFIRAWSRALQEAIATLSRRVRAGDWLAGLSAFGLAIVFGMVHIAGPGHGKMFAISYFSGREAKLRDGIAYSAIANIVDSTSAFALVMLGYVVLRAIIPSFRTDGPRILQIVSYSIVVVFGVAHLISHLRHGAHDHGSHDHSRGPHQHTDHNDSDHDHSDHEQANPKVSKRPIWLLAASVGLVPCPVSTILIVYGIANGVLPLMILMVFGVSIGGFIVMSVMSGAVILGRSRLMSALDGGSARTVTAVLEYAASGAIIVVGVILLLGSL